MIFIDFDYNYISIIMINYNKIMINSLLDLMELITTL